MAGAAFEYLRVMAALAAVAEYRPLVGGDFDYDICVFYRSDTPVHVEKYLQELRKLV